MRNVVRDASGQSITNLLDLFPISQVREAWPELGGNKDELVNEISLQRDVDDITRFISENVDYCRQHVYVRSIRADDLPDNPLIEKFVELLASETDHIQIGLVPDSVTILFGEDFSERMTVDYLRPIQIVRSGSHLFFHLVILKPSFASLAQGSVRVLSGLQNENDIIETHLSKFAESQPVDLNKGIKHLWETDEIDAARIEYKRPLSSCRDSMDESYLLKEREPNRYNEIIACPLNTCIFVTLGNDWKMDRFIVDATAGILSFRRFSDSNTSVESVLHRILSNN